MVNQIPEKVGTADEKSRSRVLGALVTLCVPLILGILLAWQVANRFLALQVEEGTDGNSVVLLSPAGTIPLRKTKVGDESLLQAIYPGSIPLEQTWIDWKATTGSPAPVGQQLVVLKFRSGTAIQQLENWYQEKLGTKFSHTRGWSVGEDENTAAWKRRVESHTLPEAITFHEELLHRSRGIILLQGAEGQSSEIDLYDYMASSGH